MPMNFNAPAVGDQYATLLQTVRDQQTALAQLLDSSIVGAPSNPVIGIKRYNSTSQLFEQWNGTAWVAMPLAYQTPLGFTPYNATNPAGYISAAGAPVQSVFGRTGAVTLASADVTGALGYTPVNKAGDTMTGSLAIRNGTAEMTLSLGPHSGYFFSNPTTTGWSSGGGFVRWDNATGNFTTNGSINSGGLLYGRGGGAGLGQITVSSAAPSGGADGDVWFQV